VQAAGLITLLKGDNAMKTLNELIAKQERQIKAERLKKEQQKKEIVLAALTEDPADREELQKALVDLYLSAVELGNILDKTIKSLEEKM